MDCMMFMKDKPDKYYDLAIVDPPYGINYSLIEHPDRPTKKWKNPDSKKYKHFGDTTSPTKKYFDELFRISKNQVIWGANNFNDIPANGCWIIWDKEVDPKERLSMAELAWTSFKSKVMIYRYLWAGFKKKEQVERIHPTQKPVDLYRWILQNYAKPGMKILDTHGGSMSIAIACDMEGFDLDITEIDKEYFQAATTRYYNYKRQPKLFANPKAGSAEQKTLKIFTDND